MKPDEVEYGRLTSIGIALVIAVGLAYLGVRLKAIQVDEAAKYGEASSRQSVWNVKTVGIRGRIVDRNGEKLADNRVSMAIVCEPAGFQRRSWEATIAAIEQAIAEVGARIGRPATISGKEIRQHVNRRERALPLTVWRDLDVRELAVFSEHQQEFPGFNLMEFDERIYPQGSLAAHLIGYVGRPAPGSRETLDADYRLVLPEPIGKSGLEAYYNGYLRGVSGVRKLLVDARCLAIREWTAVKAQKGPDLRLTLDVGLQRVVEAQLAGERGACVVMDPRNGEILAMASAPSFDLNDCVPIFPFASYRRLKEAPALPLLNRAVDGTYAPGSTFKPVTALAGLGEGLSESESYGCSGVFTLGQMHLRCTARWGHGELDLREAMMKSCNPFFCYFGVEAGTNALVKAAHSLGLGSRTGVDFMGEHPGVVPTADWKLRTYHEPWYFGDLVQMSIGQGMLLVTPLQMARMAGALGTGYLVRPHLKLDQAPERVRLPFPREHLQVVREGMRMVVAGHDGDRGTGWRAGDEVAVPVAGKTGTAEVGPATNRRKNAWIIAYAPADAPTVALALVIENGQSGGGTAAPKAGAILKAVFNDR